MEKQDKLSIEQKQKFIDEWQRPRHFTNFVIFGLSFVYFLVFGIIVLAKTSNIFQTSFQYSQAYCGGQNVSSIDQCQCVYRNRTTGKVSFTYVTPNFLQMVGATDSQNMTLVQQQQMDILIENYFPDEQIECYQRFVLTEFIKGPIYVYYYMSNYYQNHRAYFESKDLDQLSGTYKPVSDLNSCTNAKTNAEMGKTMSYLGDNLLPNDPATPCGLIAKTFFNDQYELYNDILDLNAYVATGQENINAQQSRIIIDESNIAWESDKDFYRNTDQLNKQWIDHTDYYNIVLYDTDLYVVLQTLNNFGGKNYVLGWTHIICAIISLAAVTFFAVQSFKEIKLKKSNQINLNLKSA